MSVDDTIKYWNNSSEGVIKTSFILRGFSLLNNISI